MEQKALQQKYKINIPSHTTQCKLNTKNNKKCPPTYQNFFGSQKKIELFFCQRGNDVTQRTDQTNRTNDVFH